MRDLHEARTKTCTKRGVLVGVLPHVGRCDRPAVGMVRIPGRRGWAACAAHADMALRTGATIELFVEEGR